MDGLIVDEETEAESSRSETPSVSQCQKEITKERRSRRRQPPERQRESRRPPRDQGGDTDSSSESSVEERSIALLHGFETNGEHEVGRKMEMRETRHLILQRVSSWKRFLEDLIKQRYFSK
ncbi:hypothetical protein DY000_02024281 [Brassica cretica]|uniref:Uncharacterized protein n=1 Tax=Brassica cretica TaxID=69181 RepID=A0ABQ7E349_BRACR|nr:hypothetical protein DY000_02024281 [Brassica cretica]